MRQKQGQKRQIPVLFGILKKYSKIDTRSVQKKKISPELLSRCSVAANLGSEVWWTSIGQRWDHDGGSAAVAGPVETSCDLESLA